MSERGLHYIADDLSETWVEDWAGAGVAEIETSLAKHAAFLGYLEDRRGLTAFRGAGRGNAPGAREARVCSGAASPGHPLHPPLTDATIGTYTFATVAAVLTSSGSRTRRPRTAGGWRCRRPGRHRADGADRLRRLAADQRGTPLKRTATAHMIASCVATVFFLVAIGAGYSDGIDGVVTTGAFVLTLIGFALLTLGGWLGGAIVFVHGMRVLNLVDEPASRAASPIPHPEEEAAEK